MLLASEEIVEAAVVAVPDEHAGKRLHVVVRRSNGSGSTVSSCVGIWPNGCRRRRSRRPSRSDREPLPRTSTGKVDRQVLVSKFAEKGSGHV